MQGLKGLGELWVGGFGFVPQTQLRFSLQSLKKGSPIVFYIEVRVLKGFL